MRRLTNKWRDAAPAILSVLVLVATLIASGLVLIANHLAHNPSGVRISEIATLSYDPNSGEQIAEFVFPKIEGAEKALFFTGLQGPVLISVGTQRLAEFGSLSLGMAPRSQDEVLLLPKTLSEQTLTIKWGTTSVRKGNVNYSNSALIVDASSGRAIKFAKEFLSSYSFIGIGTTLTLLGLLIFLFNLMDRANKRPTGLFGLSLIGQGLVALYFSRIFFEIPDLNQTAIHVPAFLIYLASAGAYFLYFGFQPSKLAAFLKGWSIIPVAGIVFVLATLVIFGIGSAVEVYKYSLVATLPGWYLAAGSIFALYVGKDDGRNSKRFVSGSLFASAVLVALAQTNDVIRVFAITSFPYNIGPLVFFFCSILILGNIAIDFSLRQRNIIKNERKIALSEMVSAISHDVRKPLSMVKIVLNAIRSMENPTEIRDLAVAAVPEVQKSLDSVEGLLQDVMHIGSGEIKLFKEITTPESVLDSVLAEIFRGHQSADISIQFDTDSNLFLEVDVSKVRRIFSNIIANACQAINWRGAIFISAKQSKNRVSFSIWNRGSYIDTNTLPHLFDAFYTRNKRGGTGLGLAIAKKWTEAHHGSISCETQRDNAFPDGRVEFKFDLPLTEKSLNDERPKVHGHSRDYGLSMAFAGKGQEDKISAPSVDKLKARLLRRSKVLNIVALDDESAYLSGLNSTLQALSLGTKVQMALLSSEPQSGLPVADVYLIDYDLGLANRNGADVIQSIRESDPGALICLHTNRTDSKTFNDAIDSGADVVYPKPLSNERLAHLIDQSLNRIDFV